MKKAILLRRLRVPGSMFDSQHVVVFVAAFAMLGGAILLATSTAATPTASIFAHNGSPSGNVQIVPDSTSADGLGVAQFGVSVPSSSLPSPGTWSNITGNLSGQTGGWVRIFGKPNSAIVIAGVEGQGLWSNSGGSTWSKLGTGAGSTTITSFPTHIAFDPTNPNTFFITSIYGDYGTYKTVNGGTTITRLNDGGHHDFVSVDYTDPARKTVLLGVHEGANNFMRSTDGGSTFTNITGSSTSASTDLSFLASPIAVNDKIFVVPSELSWYGHTATMIRTTNGGATWSIVKDIQNAEIHVSGRGIFTATGDIFYRGDYNFSGVSSYLYKSSDGGATWHKITGTFTLAPIELPDGRLVTTNNSKFIVSSDRGETWTAFGASLPCQLSDLASIAYSPGQSALFLRDPNCNGGAIQRLQ